MAQLNRTQLKAKFENGDIPTQADFADLIDSLALKSEAGGSTPSASTMEYNLVQNRYNVLAPYLCFNHPNHTEYRGVLGACGKLPSSNGGYTNNYYNNVLDFQIATKTNTGTVSGLSYFGPDSSQINTTLNTTVSKYVSLVEAESRATDSNGNAVYFNNGIPTLEYLMPIIANGLNPSLSRQQVNFYEEMIITNDGKIIPTDSSPFCITAQGFNRPMLITNLYIAFVGNEDCGLYNNITIPIIDFNYNVSAIASDITIEPGCFSIDVPVSVGFANSVTYSVESYAFQIDISGVMLDTGVGFAFSDTWGFNDRRLNSDWYHGSDVMDITGILRDNIS